MSQPHWHGGAGVAALEELVRITTESGHRKVKNGAFGGLDAASYRLDEGDSYAGACSEVWAALEHIGSGAIAGTNSVEITTAKLGLQAMREAWPAIPF